LCRGQRKHPGSHVLHAQQMITRDSIPITVRCLQSPVHGFDSRLRLSLWLLNRFFRDYHATHGQGGTNTKQRNLWHLFTWLEAEYGHPHPYTDGLNRYAPVKTRPSTLSLDLIKDLLEVTGGLERASCLEGRFGQIPEATFAFGQPVISRLTKQDDQVVF